MLAFLGKVLPCSKTAGTRGQAPAPPENIPGIEVCSFAIGQDAESVYRADEEAFLDQRGHFPRAFEQWKQWLNLEEETFDPSVWLIAWDENDIASVALSLSVNGMGWILHLTVRRLWRRRGLGMALILSVLSSF